VIRFTQLTTSPVERPLRRLVATALLLLAACRVAPLEVTVPGIPRPETDCLVEALAGTLLEIDGDEVPGTTFPSLAGFRVAIPVPEDAEVQAFPLDISGPDSSGQIAYLRTELTLTKSSETLRILHLDGSESEIVAGTPLRSNATINRLRRSPVGPILVVGLALLAPFQGISASIFGEYPDPLAPHASLAPCEGRIAWARLSGR
jgi:hypothetical protein